MIEIIAETTSGLYNYSEELEELLNRHKNISNWWYFHGQLENEVGFDKGIMLDNNNLKYLEFIDKDTNKSYQKYYLETGIYNVKIVQIDKPCIGYFWTSFEEFSNINGKIPTMRGLVVFADDKEANDYAYKKYCEKSEIV